MDDKMGKTMSKQMQKAAGNVPHFTFRSVSVSMAESILPPKGYRMATVQEMERGFNSNQSFNEELLQVGYAWAKERDGRTVCVTVFDGIFNVCDVVEGVFKTDIAPVAFVRDEHVDISRSKELAENLRNSLSKELRSMFDELGRM